MMGIPKLPPNANDKGLLPLFPEKLTFAAPTNPEIKGESFLNRDCENKATENKKVKSIIFRIVFLCFEQT
jgi:hypothetical protein